MAEHRFTNETATIVVLGYTDDMRHVLGRITSGLILLGGLMAVSALVDTIRHDWLSAALSSAAALWWWLLSAETSKRRRKYQHTPTPRTPESADERGA